MSPQTHSWQAQPPQPGVGLAWQPSHSPQSALQLSQVSPNWDWQIRLPQQLPQSPGQVLHVSP